MGYNWNLAGRPLTFQCAFCVVLFQVVAGLGRFSHLFDYFWTLGNPSLVLTTRVRILVLRAGGEEDGYLATPVFLDPLDARWGSAKHVAFSGLGGTEGRPFAPTKRKFSIW